MRLFLVRHAHAVDASEDPARPLSGRGRREVGQLAGFLRASGSLAPDEFWHSPLARARETAQLLADGLGSRSPLKEAPGLEPDEDPAAIALRLASEHRTVALVGHEPQLSTLATLLVRGTPWPPAFVMQKCSVLALERNGEGRGASWVARWHVVPDLLKA